MTPVATPSTTPTPEPTPTPTPVSTPTPTATATPTATPPCFRAGTLILTARGEVVVEQLVAGDQVISPDGKALAVKWVGWRHLDIARSSERHRLWPIRIARGAIAENVPRRDLFISPDHAVYLDGLLIPAAALVNGATITQSQDVKDITYYHIELERHGIVLAEGVAAESYIDTGNRSFFANAPGGTVLHPVLLPSSRRLSWLPRRVARALSAIAVLRFYDRHAVAPWADSGRAATRIRRALAARAQILGYRRTRDPDLVLVADGRLMRPSIADARMARFTIPAGAKRLRLLSRSVVPAEVVPGAGDRRRLGIAVIRIVFEDNGERWVMKANDPRLHIGFHPAEQRLWQSWRWTDGAAEVPPAPADRPFVLEVQHRPSIDYWLAPIISESEARRA
jgi:hypothetical protein